MAYDFYLGKVLLPVPPEKLQLKINNANKTCTLINEGEINMLKTPGLTDIDFEFELPCMDNGIGKYKNGFLPVEYFLSVIELLKLNKEPFQFIVARALPGGKSLYGTNMKVSVEDYSINEEAGNGFDTAVSIALKQYRDYGTKVCSFSYGDTGVNAQVSQSRAAGSNVPAAKTYTVQKGDCLWKIAANYYGKGSEWNKLYDANKSVVGGNPNLIYPGQVLTIP